MLSRLLPATLACSLLFVIGCATAPLAEIKLWQTKPVRGAEGPLTQVTFAGGKTPVIARADSFYRDYRVIPRHQYEKYHVPGEASSAYSGRLSVDHDVVYVVETPTQWRVYGYTFGLYDLDFPPKLLGTVAK